MNDIKQELLKTVGNVSQQKQRVITNVEKKLHPEKKPRKWRAVPLVLMAVVMICIFLMMPKFISQEQQATFQAPDTSFIEMYRIQLEAYWDNIEYAESDAISKYVYYTAFQAYAFDNNITVTDEELKAAHERYYQIELSEEVTTRLEQTYLKYGYSWDDYVEFIDGTIIPFNALERKLQQPFEEQYSKFYDETAKFMLEQEIYKHFDEQHTELFNDFRLKYEFYSPLYGGSANSGVVVEVNDQAIRIVEGYKNAADQKVMGNLNDEDTPLVNWVPRLTNQLIEVGNRLTFWSSGSYSKSSAAQEGKYSPVKHATTIEVLTDETIKFSVSDKKILQHFVSTLSWDAPAYETSEQPHYMLTDGLYLYEAWLSEDRATIIIRDRQQELFSQVPLTTLLNWLEDNNM